MMIALRRCSALRLRTLRDAARTTSSSSSDFAGAHQSPVTEFLWRSREAAKKDEHSELGKYPVVPDGLLLKPPSATRTTVRYDFSKDSGLKDTYRNPWDFVRHGLLLEDLDALAGNTAAMHCSDGDSTTEGPMLVTASVDNVKMLNRLNMNNDLTLTGSVAWTGRSAMLIRMIMTDDTTNTKLMEAGFTFVARNREDPTKSAAINRLAPETAEEVELFETLQARDEQRKMDRKDQAALDEATKVTAAAVRSLLDQAHTLITMPSLVTDDSMLISQTRVENSLMCQPQQRNLSGRIFGGFLMRRAFELAFSACYLHGGSRPHFLELEKVVFVTPVDIGDLLRLVAHVTYSEMDPTPLVHIEVVASVVNPEDRTAVVSNVFNFTFALNLHLESGHNQTMKSVVPGTGSEARRHLIAKEYVLDNIDDATVV